MSNLRNLIEGLAVVAVATIAFYLAYLFFAGLIVALEPERPMHSVMSPP